MMLQNLPTMERPMVLKLNLRVPSLKNNKIPVTNKQGQTKLISNSRVSFFNKTTVPLFEEMQKRQGFITIPQDSEVLAWVRVVVYGKKKTSNKDLDNMWTTAQECLQHAGIVMNDNQICGTWSEKHTTGIKALQHFVIWLWVANTTIPYFEQAERVYHDIIHKKKV